jgi:hypothetical protein
MTLISLIALTRPEVGLQNPCTSLALKIWRLAATIGIRVRAIKYLMKWKAKRFQKKMIFHRDYIGTNNFN